MARVTCPDCNLTYDDVYRWTYCPHEAFEMRTRGYRYDPETNQLEERLLTSVEEARAFMAER